MSVKPLQIFKGACAVLALLAFVLAPVPESAAHTGHEQKEAEASAPSPEPEVKPPVSPEQPEVKPKLIAPSNTQHETHDHDAATGFLGGSQRIPGPPWRP